MLAHLPLSLLLLVHPMLARAERNITLQASNAALRLSPRDSWTVGVTTGTDGAESVRGSAAKVSNHPEARLEFNFTGTALYWSTVRGPARGLMRICIDCNGSEGMVPLDEYKDVQDTSPTISWSQTGLPNAQHRLIVSNMRDPRSRRFSDVVVGGIRYTKAELYASPSMAEEPLAARAMGPTGRMRLAVILAICVPIGALLLGYLIYRLLLRRRRSRLPPSELWRQRATATTPSRMMPSFAWTQNIHLPIRRSRKKTVVTPYQLPPIASPEHASRGASPMTIESHLESQITSITNSLSPVRTPARSGSETGHVEADTPYTPVFSPGSLNPRYVLNHTSSHGSATESSPRETENTYSPIFTPNSATSKRSREISARNSLKSHFPFPPRFSREVRRKDSASHITPYQLPPINPSSASANVSRNSSLNQGRSPSQMSMQYPPMRMDSKHGLNTITPSPTSPVEYSPSHIPPQRHSSAFVIVGGPSVSPRGAEPPSPGYSDQPSSSRPPNSTAPLILNPPSPAHLHAQRAPFPNLVLGHVGPSSQPIASPPAVADPDVKTPIPPPRPRGGRRRKDPGGPSFQPPRQKTPPPPYHG